MKIEDQVVSLELAKELKELGVKQDSLWVWVKGVTDKYGLVLEWDVDLRNKTYSAYTIAELGEMLPDGYSSLRRDEIWCCEDVYYEQAKTEANARAKMLLRLIKEGIIDVGEIE